MGQAQINVRTRACSRTSIARTRQAALTHNVRGKELKKHNKKEVLEIHKMSEHWRKNDTEHSICYGIYCSWFQESN